MNTVPARNRQKKTKQKISTQNITTYNGIRTKIVKKRQNKNIIQTSNNLTSNETRTKTVKIILKVRVYSRPNHYLCAHSNFVQQ